MRGHRFPDPIKTAGIGLVLLVVSGCVPADFGADLTVHLTGEGTIERKTIRYQCDATGVNLGLPQGPFPVEYINGAGNSLAVLPVAGKSLIFANVVSGSGARYVARQFTWWDGRAITFSSDAINGKAQSVCQRVAGGNNIR
jgi:membrane-bound inhibitor of C-type lysozyme